MEKRKIGSLDVTVVGVGCNNFGQRVDPAGTAQVVKAALDAGINFFDTADYYSAGKSEEYLGRALQGQRKNVIIATKFGLPMGDGKSGARPAYVKQACADSLRRLGTDTIDLYQLHFPDPETPIADTLGALGDLVRDGKVREIGCSNFTAAQLKEAHDAVQQGAPRFVSVQNEYNLLKREVEADVLPACQQQGVGFIPYFPLASGLLTGKYKPGGPPPNSARFGPAGFSAKMYTEGNLKLVEALGKIAAQHGHSMLQLAFSWLLTRPAVASVIAGAMTPEQVSSNAQAYVGRLGDAELAAIDAVLAQA